MRGMITPTELLPDPLPSEPLQIAHDWLAEAWQACPQGNANAMTLATSTLDGVPSARIVLCKEIVPRPGYVVFYTNYSSRKGRELATNPRAAAVMHWDSLRRQVRIEGLVGSAPAADSDAYFATRALESRIGAWASAQSEPIASRSLLLEAVEAAERRLLAPQGGAARRGAPDTFVPRPPYWGGYRVWAQVVELWVEGAARIHDRARWSRELTRHGDGRIVSGPWSATRLQP